MKVKERLNLYEMAVKYEVITKAKKSNKKTKDEVVMDKLNLAKRLEKCISIKEIEGEM